MTRCLLHRAISSPARSRRMCQPWVVRMVSVWCLLLMGWTSLAACSVPVFAYALRRWEHDPHLLVTAREAALRDQVSQLLTTRRLTTRAAGVELVPAGDVPSGILFPDGQLRWWDGEIADEQLAGVLDSPARRELVRRLVSGESVVWIHLVAPGDAQADATSQRVQARLDHLASSLTLPALDPHDPATVRTMDEIGPPLRIAFSVLRVAVDDPAEWALVAQLRALAGADHQGSLLAPIYGRARALAALPPTAWEDAIIDDATFFLTGACSCQVKLDNPGVDLLVGVDWSAELAAVTVPWDGITGTSADPALQDGAMDATDASDEATTDVIVTTTPPLPAPVVATPEIAPARWPGVLALVLGSLVVLAAATSLIVRGRR